MEDFAQNPQPHLDPTSIGQAIGKAVADSLKPLVDRLDDIAERIGGSGVTLSENETRLSKSLGLNPSQTKTLISDASSSADMREIRTAVLEIRDAVNGLGVSLATGDK